MRNAASLRTCRIGTTILALILITGQSAADDSQPDAEIGAGDNNDTVTDDVGTRGARNPTLASDWRFSVGTAFTSADPRIGLAPDGVPVTLIDLDTLGIDPDDNDWYFQATWQGLQRWRFDINVYTTKVDGGVFSDRDYQFGNLEIPAGSGLAIDVKTRFYIFSASYAIWQRPRWEAGASLGVYGLDWEGGIDLVEGGTGAVLGQESTDFIAPLPTVGLFGRFAFSDRLAGRIGFDWLGLTIDEYDGEVLALNAELDWWFNDRWGVTAGVNVVDINVEVDDEPFNEFVDAEWESLFLNLNLAF